MIEMQEKRGRPPGKQFPDRLVIPVSAGFKQQVAEAAEAGGVAAAAWVRQAMQDRLDGVVRVAIDGAEYTGPADYDY